MNNILAPLIITALLLLVALLAMSFKVLFIKGGKFPNTHIGGNKALKKQGIGCATSQDREDQKQTRQNKD